MRTETQLSYRKGSITELFIRNRYGTGTFFTKFKIKITPQFCKAGSGYALRKTAGSGSAKNAADPKAILIHTE